MPIGGGVRERLGRDEVAATDLGRVHADLGGEEVDGALDRGGGLGATGATVRDASGVVLVSDRAPSVNSTFGMSYTPVSHHPGHHTGRNAPIIG